MFLAGLTKSDDGAKGAIRPSTPSSQPKVGADPPSVQPGSPLEGLFNDFFKNKIGVDDRNPSISPKTKVFGFDLENSNEDLRKRYGIKESVKGVVITGVDDSAFAAQKRMAPGDVIVEVGGEAVTSPNDVNNLSQRLKNEGRKTALLLLANREGTPRFVAVDLHQPSTSPLNSGSTGAVENGSRSSNEAPVSPGNSKLQHKRQ